MYLINIAAMVHASIRIRIDIGRWGVLSGERMPKNLADP